MVRWIWIVVAFTISTSVYFVIRYGLRPKPIPVMNPTEFKSAEQIGIAVYKRLRQNLRAERVVVLGAPAGLTDDLNLWNGLINAAHADGEKILSFRGEQLRNSDFLEEVGRQVSAGNLVVIEAPTAEVSHLVSGSLSQQLEKIVRHPVLSISALPLAIEKSEYETIQTQCLDDASAQSPTERLNCAAQRVARKYLKRKLAPEKIWAVMERQGLKEYLVFVHRPAN